MKHLIGPVFSSNGKRLAPGTVSHDTSRNGRSVSSIHRLRPKLKLRRTRVRVPKKESWFDPVLVNSRRGRKTFHRVYGLLNLCRRVTFGLRDGEQRPGRGSFPSCRPTIHRRRGAGRVLESRPSFSRSDPFRTTRGAGPFRRGVSVPVWCPVGLRSPVLFLTGSGWRNGNWETLKGSGRLIHDTDKKSTLLAPNLFTLKVRSFTPTVLHSGIVTSTWKSGQDPSSINPRPPHRQGDIDGTLVSGGDRTSIGKRPWYTLFIDTLLSYLGIYAGSEQDSFRPNVHEVGTDASTDQLRSGGTPDPLCRSGRVVGRIGVSDVPLR